MAASVGSILLPSAAVPLILPDGKMNPDWYRIMQLFAQSFNNQTKAIVANKASADASIATLNGEVSTLQGTALVAAIETDMEAAASSAVGATPAALKFHPAVPKAWAQWDGTLGSPITPARAFGVSSVTKNATGDFTLNFSTPFTDTNYGAAGMAKGDGSNVVAIVHMPNGGAKTTSALQINVRNTGATAFNSPDIFVAVWGDQ